MAKNICLVIVAFGLILQTYAVSFVNNVTVPSDILTKIFFDEIKNNDSLFNISVQDTKNYDSIKCLLGLQEIVNRFPSLDVLPFVDAWGKMPSGILYGHLADLGNFDQCIKTTAVLSEAVGTAHGQYCFASIPLIQSQTMKMPHFTDDPQVQSRALENYIKISIAICVPDSCEPSLLKVIFQKAADKVFNGALSGINVNRCKTAKRAEFETINIVGIVIFSFFGFLMLMSTLYEACMVYFLKKPVIPVLLAFSVLTNGRKLFAINTTKSPNSIDCLLGIRVLSMFWVIYCHNYSVTTMLPMMNIVDILKWRKAASTMHVLMATVSVDTFLFMSGLLLAWLGFRELDKSNGKLNVLMMYFHRYIRLTPPVAAIILFIVSINKYIVFGPYSNLFELFHDSCFKYWWRTLLYVQNYVSVDDGICVPQSWYLAVDFQLYILSPLILIPLWKWGRKFTPVMVILALLSIGCVIGTYISRGYTQFLGLLEDDQNRLTYVPTHARYSVWLVGVGFGYFMFKNKSKTIVPSKLVQLIGWTLCFTTILAIIYGPYFTLNADRATTVAEAGLYESLKRVSWGIALSWIVFACYFGFGGVINTFLSHPFWQPLARLTFSLYLVHMLVQCMNFGMTRTDVYFSDYNEVLFFWSSFGISLMAAIVLTLAFEAPILVIEKALLGNGKTKDNNRQQGKDEVKKVEIDICQKSA